MLKYCFLLVGGFFKKNKTKKQTTILFLIKYPAIAFGKMKLSFIVLEHEEAKPNQTGFVSCVSNNIK